MGGLSLSTMQPFYRFVGADLASYVVEGGALSLPAVVEGGRKEKIAVAPFYMDEIFVTNQST